MISVLMLFERGMDARKGRDAQRLDAQYDSPVLRQRRRAPLNSSEIPLLKETNKFNQDVYY
ncbi:hypothetical protein BZ856_20405 [Salmonella enterica subsp. enterica serovar Enteritidis]|nr:hypothetical protein [Salmonella enterica subsp. enterica serovar Enteritidis]